MAHIIAVYREVEEVERAPRPRIFRDRENPLDFYQDHEIYQRFRFDRAGSGQNLILICGRGTISTLTKLPVKSDMYFPR